MISIAIGVALGILLAYCALAGVAALRARRNARLNEDYGGLVVQAPVTGKHSAWWLLLVPLVIIAGPLAWLGALLGYQRARRARG